MCMELGMHLRFLVATRSATFNGQTSDISVLLARGRSSESLVLLLHGQPKEVSVLLLLFVYPSSGNSSKRF